MDAIYRPNPNFLFCLRFMKIKHVRRVGSSTADLPTMEYRARVNSVTISGSLKVAKNSLAFYEGGKMDSKGLQNGQRLPSHCLPPQAFGVISDAVNHLEAGVLEAGECCAGGGRGRPCWPSRPLCK